MPLVVINRNPKKIDNEVIERLYEILPGAVANCLSFSGYELTENDIEIQRQEFGPQDKNTKDLEIIIWASFYRERRKNLDSKIAILVQKIKPLLPPGVNGYVWIMLPPAAFKEL